MEGSIREWTALGSLVHKIYRILSYVLRQWQVAFKEKRGTERINERAAHVTGLRVPSTSVLPTPDQTHIFIAHYFIRIPDSHICNFHRARAQLCPGKSRTSGTEWVGGFRDTLVIKVCFLGKINAGGEFKKAKSKQRERGSLMYVGGTMIDQTAEKIRVSCTA